MRIGVDLRPFYTGSRFRGIGIYAKNLIEAMLRLAPEHEYHFLNVYGDFPSGIALNEHCFVHSYYHGPMIEDCGNRNIFRIPELECIREAQVIDFLNSSKIDWMLFTSPLEYGNPFRIEWFQSVHTAAVMYDLIPLAFPKQCLFDDRFKSDYMDSLEFIKRVDLLLSISQFTKDDTIRRLGITEKKIKVIMSGIDYQYLDVHSPDLTYLQKRFPLCNQYFLFAGGIDFKKNIERIIGAYGGLPKAHRENAMLVIAGKTDLSTIEHYMDEAKKAGVEKSVICTNYVSDKELTALYCNACALVFPSLYEGFGLPVIEAMACGTAVITSNSSSLKEVAGDHAILVDPEDTDQICKAMQYVLENPKKIEKMTQAAIPYAKQFTWIEVAKKALHALNTTQIPPHTREKSKPFVANNAMLKSIAHEYCTNRLPLTEKECSHISDELYALEKKIMFPAIPCGKRILYDVTVIREWLENHYITGICRASLEIYHEIKKYAEVIPVSIETKNGQFLLHSVDMQTFQIQNNEIEPSARDVYFMPELQIRGIQIPANHPRPGQLREKGVQTYAVLYDILPLQMPQYFEEKTAKAFYPYVRDMISDYDGILTDSRAVSDEVIQYCMDHRELQIDHTVKIGWFHNGVDTFAEATDADSDGPDIAEFFSGQVFLMVGTIEPRKGHQLVFKAFEELWGAGCGAKLCFIGRAGWSMEGFIEQLKAHKENGHKFLFLEGASDQILHFAYTHSAALIQASAGEGFGLPIIEAGQYGLPVICSDIPVFHEIADVNAIYFCRGNLEELQTIIRNFGALLKNGKIPDSSRIKYCSWSEAACRVANIILANSCWYKEILPDRKIKTVEQRSDIYHPLAFSEMRNEQEVTDGEHSQNEKAILLVHPNNFLQGGQGENNRTLAVARLLKEIGYAIDLLSFENFAAYSSFATFAADNAEGLIRNLYLYDFKSGYKEDYASKQCFTMNQYLQDWTRPGMHILFEDAISEHNYAAIGIFYTYLANLLADTEVVTKKWYFMEDSMFIQQASWGGADVSLGKMMDEELKKLQLFDNYFCISYDEKIMYEKLTGRQMNFLPHIMPADFHVVTTLVEERKYDIAFVGANNIFNVEGLQWFVDKVYPLLNRGIKAVFVGAATKAVKNIPNTITVIPFAKDLDVLFDDVKVSICPMFRGTGMKIKVVEAMAHGIPLVCNERGVDGLPDKMMSGCIVTNDAQEFANAINLLVSDGEFYQEKSEQIKAYYRTIFERGQYIELIDTILKS